MAMADARPIARSRFQSPQRVDARVRFQPEEDLGRVHRP